MNLEMCTRLHVFVPDACVVRVLFGQRLRNTPQNNADIDFDIDI